MDRKVLLGVGVAAAAAAAAGAAAAAYLLFKDEKESRRRLCHVSSRPVSVNVRVRMEDAGVVIGRGGDTIREIQRRTNTRIHFLDEKETDTHRVLAIKGSPEEVQLAEILVHQTIANQPHLETLVMTVPGFSVGTIIGYGGKSIKEIQQTSRCKIDVERTSGDGPRKVTLKGTESQINCAKDLIDNKILLARERQLTDSVRRNLSSDSLRSQGSTSAGISNQTRPPLLYLKSEVEEDVCLPLSSNDRQEVLWDPVKTNVDSAEIIEVYVSSISDPSKFYVQKVGPQSIELDRLAEEMSSYYDLEANRLNSTLDGEDVVEGDIVAAKFSSDNKWYRAKVVSVLPDDYDETQTEIDVDFVDFGDYERMLRTEVCKIRPEFLKLTFQAIDCALAHVEPLAKEVSDNSSYGSEWSDDCIDAFERLSHAAQWQVMLAKLVSFPSTKNDDDAEDMQPSVCIELIDGSTSSRDINVGVELGRLGLVNYTGHQNLSSSPADPTFEGSQSDDDSW